MNNHQKEIGGYLELENFHGSLYHNNAIALNSGRHSLAYLIELYNIKSILIPDFICNSITATLKKYNVSYTTYTIKPDFTPDNITAPNNNQWLYLVDYYGQVPDDIFATYKEIFNNRLIVDEAQNFFRMPYDNISTIYTCRKFFGVPDGGFVYPATSKTLNRSLEQSKSLAQMEYVLGRYEYDGSTYYKQASKNNKRFNNEDVMYMSKITNNILRAVNYEMVIEKRNSNFSTLQNLLGKYNRLAPTHHNGPYMYPLYVKNAGNIRKTLADKKIYIPTLWPDVLNNTEASLQAIEYAKNILPLPLDQRYTESDMRYVCEELIDRKSVV